jgi:hypothetical protein
MRDEREGTTLRGKERGLEGERRGIGRERRKCSREGK